MEGEGFWVLVRRGFGSGEVWERVEGILVDLKSQW